MMNDERPNDERITNDDAQMTAFVIAKNDWDRGVTHWVLSSDMEIHKAAKQDNGVT